MIEYICKKENIMDDIILNTEEKMKKAIENIESRWTNVRAGRANPNMLDGLNIEYYGTLTPIKQLSNISVPEARQLMIKPFDKNCLGLIEKSIYEANLGLTPNNNGESIFLVIPALTEERRREFVKQVKIISEEGKIALRNIRQDANNNIKNTKCPEDEQKNRENEIQELINKFNKIIDEKLKEKENELMSI